MGDRRAGTPPVIRRLAPAILTALLSTIPILEAVASAPDVAAYVGDPNSELPVKLWGFRWYAENAFFGGPVGVLAWPHPGALNNPDLVATAWMYGIGGLVGASTAYNTFLLAQLAAASVSAWWLSSVVTGDRWASVIAGVAYALTPCVLAYCVVGAVTDMLSLWPWPLAIGLLIRAVRDRDVRAAVGSGVSVGVGFVTCPYNLITFVVLAPPAAVLLPALVGRAGVRGSVRIACAGLLGVLPFFAAYGLQMHSIMADPSSQVSSAFVSSTRHAPPFPFLVPSHEAYYVARLRDYVAVGKATLITRDAGSRYYRAFSPGIVVLILASCGVLLATSRRQAVVWFSLAAFAVVASTGPFLGVTPSLYLTRPWNPAWNLMYWVIPGGKLLLEPFRYAIPGALALGVAAAFGLRVLVHRLGWMLAPVTSLLLVGEVAYLSPVPWPLPTATFTVPDVYARLDALLPPGPIIELPWFDHASERFDRAHFLQQLVHRRPIADGVTGFPPLWFADNAFMALLLHTEKDRGVLRVAPQAISAAERAERLAAARGEIVSAGFVGIVLDPEAVGAQDRSVRLEKLLSEAYGVPLAMGERWVWRIR